MKDEQRQAIVAQVKKRYQVISPHLTERAKRIWAASEVLVIGRGGTTIVCEATGHIAYDNYQREARSPSTGRA